MPRPAGWSLSASGWLVEACSSARDRATTAVCLLLSEKRPKPLLLQAGILNRSLFETLVNIAALISEPAQTKILQREGFRAS